MKTKDLQIGQIIMSNCGRFYSVILKTENIPDDDYVKLIELAENGSLQRNEVYDEDLEEWIILHEAKRF